MNQPRFRILVVDDNRSSADALARLLRKQGDEVEVEYDGAAAIQRLRTDPPHVVLTDLKMEPIDGMQVLAVARSLRPPVETIVFTAYGAVDVAVRAMHLGARDFLTKPVTVEQVANRLDELRRSLAGPQSPDDEELDVTDDGDFVARSESSRALLATLERAAAFPTPVWVEGEIGSGRSFVARTLHRLGDQQTGSATPYAVRNVLRPTEPWPSEGTVLLSNVDDLGLDEQRELHRELQLLPDGVRVIATSQPDGRRRVAEGELRAELYYRMAVVVIQVPPLRRRPEDIVPLFERALDAFAERYGRPRQGISAQLKERLQRHYWPGNIRELVNLAERAAVLGEEGVQLDVIEESAPGLPKIEQGFNLSNYLEGVERRILVEALRKSKGDRAAAGKLLGVERNTLRYKLNKYGL
ncbi:MAG: sigma-54-dependent Fis family transcriptional regulator, partial [Myxococcales bacterium]|nr:sigma-54-dependent Fis family transcriptional regulator [Myxococcales bacterium]